MNKGLRTAIFTVLAGLNFSFSLPVQAQDVNDGKSPTIAVQKMICQRLYVHQPSPDVAYQPGVDVNGNAVAPADVQTPFQAVSTDYIEVPFQVNLAERLGMRAQKGQDMYATLGNLRLYNDGRVLYNGQDLTSQAQALCGGMDVPPASIDMQPSTQQLGRRGMPVGETMQARTVPAMAVPDVPMPGTAAPSTTVTP